MAQPRPQHKIPVGLKWVELSAEPPPGLPRGGKQSGSRAAGLRYEKRVALAIPEAKHGHWIRYEDESGPGWCQPDFILPLHLAGKHLYTVVFEAKLSHTMVGHLQIEELYGPILERLWGYSVRGIVVCRHLTPDIPKHWITADLSSALARCISGSRTVWHLLA